MSLILILIHSEEAEPLILVFYYHLISCNKNKSVLLDLILYDKINIIYSFQNVLK